MALRIRTRCLTFRLSADEYESVKRVCANEQARSLSDFARAAILERVAMGLGERISLTTDVRRLGMRLKALEGVLKDTSGQIEKILGSESEG